MVDSFFPSSGSGIETLCLGLEEARGRLAEEIWRQVTGRPFDVGRLEQLVEGVMRRAQAICFHPEAGRRLAVGAGLEEELAERFNPRMGFSTLRRSLIRCSVVQMEGAPITLELWVKFLRSREGASERERQLVFDSFLEQAPKLGQAIEGQLRRFEELARRMGMTVRSLYETRVGLPWEELRYLLERVVEGLSLSTKMAMTVIGSEILGRPPAYYDCPWSLTFLGDRRWDWLLEGGKAVDVARRLLGWRGLEGAACPDSWDLEARPH